ncbi:protein kinase [Streptomyces sp. TRM66268-LWL]|uniref:Protein kinase n=1 Tax=Streptomyces polyasparticus TaxID=2767826 RepID=A0ABR7SP35_9ACTN|nr:serine/threonine-protein kinase [Streptomyces polyasparticus]MBC9716337.1 protein kinase [Streptomyces polyasparticus]
MELRDSDPREIGGYTVEERLGSGGMGVVYRARTASGRPLAVKVVHTHYADDEEFRVRFRRELAAARRVSGAFTAPVVDADPDADRPWMATLFIPGENLGTHVRRHGPLPLDRLRELATGLAEALRELHRTDVIHRDLKPANVMLAEDGPRVIDFGISRGAAFHDGQPLTDTGRVMGTPPYMSPEQLADPREVGPPADVFSLGSVLVYAATGRGPFDGENPYETAIRVVEGAPQLEGVPRELRPVVERCLDKSPKARPTPDELLALLRGAPLPPPPQDPLPTEPTPRRPLPLPGVLGVIGLVVALVAAFFLVRPLLDADDKPQGQEAKLPAGYRAWQSRASAPSGLDAQFNGCAVHHKGGLVCAGADYAAVRFALADGAVGWHHPIDPTADDEDFGEGAVIGESRGGILVYNNADESKGTGDDAATSARYSILSLDPGTGGIRWQTPVGHGDRAPAPAPGPEWGGAAVLPSGVVTFTGRNGSSYTLLDGASGKALWTAPTPAKEQCGLQAAAGRAYLLCVTADYSRTRIGSLDPRTGRPTWADLGGDTVLWLGGHRGRAVLAVGPADAADYTRLLAVEPGAPDAAGDSTSGPAAGDSTSGPAEPAVRSIPLSVPQPGDSTPQLTSRGLYFSYANGRVDAIDPATGRRLWRGDTGLDLPGPAETTDTHVIVASPGGRVSALHRGDGTLDWTRSAPGDSGPPTTSVGPRPAVLGDALYVPYGSQSVFSVALTDPHAPLDKASPPPRPSPPATASPKTPG